MEIFSRRHNVSPVIIALIFISFFHNVLSRHIFSEAISKPIILHDQLDQSTSQSTDTSISETDIEFDQFDQSLKPLKYYGDKATVGLPYIIEPAGLDPHNSVKRLLDSCDEGKIIYASYDKNKQFLRGDLSRLIIYNELKQADNKRISTSRFITLAKEIYDIFPHEDPSIYYQPYAKTIGGKTVSARGKLWSTYISKRRSYRTSGIFKEGKTSSGNIQPFENCVGYEDNIQWLKNNTEPFSDICTLWEATFYKRFKEIPSIQEYYSTFPGLNQPLGYLLLEADFTKLYPDKKNCFFSKCQAFANNILEIAKRKKDNYINDFLTVFKETCPSPTQDNLCLVSLQVLPLMLQCPMKRKKQGQFWKPSKTELVDGFILHVNDAADLKPSLERRASKYLSYGLTAQPIPVIVGNPYKECASYVSINNVLYKLETPLKAVELCFKVYHSLGANYPFESEITWIFIQQAFFNIKTEYDKSFSSRIRHYKDRFKRQQGAHLYLPGSYVTEGSEGPDAGPWSEWSEPSPCSRTCGGGVSTQYRTCQQGYDCQGPDKRHFSCNTQDCPDAADYRSQQCSEFDDIPFETVKYQWVPYTKAPNPCELNCMPRGERFYYRHASKVVDGTRCNDENLDVCVNGKCQPVGCDMMLGSNAREDECRICGGDGSTCNTIEHTIEMNDMQVGYNDILLIPAGATNILVEETAPTNNYLAIRNTSGFYYLNGNWRVDFPRTMDFVGTKFHYDRYPQGFSAPDKLTALGPIDEPIFIVLLFQETSDVPVKYRYSLPTNVQPGSESETYAWTFDQFTPCTTTCGGGIQFRNVTCAGRKTLEAVDRKLCDPNNEPETSRRCSEIPCEAQWVPHPWGNCSAPCGEEGGVQTREISCQQIVSNGYPTLVDEAECIARGSKPPQQQKCNIGKTCANWYTGPWKPCDHLCGEGKQTRQIKCYIKNEKGKIQILNDAECESISPKPEAEKECNLRPCEGVDWITSEWSGCERICGLTNETRKVFCATVDGQIYDDKLCEEDHERPATVRNCESTNASCEYLWYASQWSDCSATCGEGVQTRTIFCGLVTPEGVKKVENENCDQGRHFETLKKCKGEEMCEGEWFSGPWGECSKQCGGGERTKKVVCIKGNDVVDPDLCDANKIIFSQEDCNQQPCTADAILSTDITKPIDESEATTKHVATTSGIFDETSTDALLSTTQSSDLTTSSEETMSSKEDDSTPSASDMTEVVEMSTESNAVTSSSDEDEYEIVAADSCDDGEWVEVGVVKKEKEETTVTELASSTEPSSGTSFSLDDLMLSDGTTDTGGDTTITGSGDGGTSPFDSSTQPSSGLTESTEEEGSGSEPSTIITDEYSTGTVYKTAGTESTEGLGSSVTSEQMTSESSTSESSTESSGSTASGLTDESGSTEIGSSSTMASTEMTTDGSSGSTETSGTSEAISGSTDSSTESSDGSSSATTSSSEYTSTSSESLSESTITTDSSSTSGSVSTETTETATTDSTEATITSESSSTSSDSSSTTEQISTTKETSSTDGASTSESTESTESSSTDLTESTTDSMTTESTTKPIGIFIVEFVPPDETTTSKATTVVSGSTDPSTEGESVSTTEYTGSTETSSEITGSTTEYTGGTETSTTFTGSTESYTGSSETTTAFSGSSETSTDFTGSTESTTDFTGSTESTTDFTGSTVSTTDFTGSTESTTELTGSTEMSTTEVSGSTEFDIFGPTTEESTTEYGTTPFTDIFKPRVRMCKRIKLKNCKKTEFGCCWDHITPAKGPFDKGCPAPKTCKESKYGCCEDGVSAALGPKLRGCPSSHCEETLFGCCEDGKTPAEGEDNEGCPIPPPACLEAKYGCCKDNVTEAKGPKQKGCEPEPSVEITTLEPPEDCSASTHGCCPDGLSVATGEYFEGCDIFKENCTKSYFGCCPDGKTSAKGPDARGCDLPCSSSMFGCCPDKVTPAHGQNSEGCCLASPFGCCPDNITPARGINHEGCGCQYSQYGCCPDNKTSAHGYNNAGCGCKYTDHGCCPDDYTTAVGPNYEGCLCHTFQFGCCPDGVSVAKGPHQQGCGCRNSEFGCCSDEETAATGPNMAGCGCEATKFGCCLDGVAEAKGENFEGCEEIPVNLQTSCSLPKERGTCKNYTVKWFYDMDYGGCSRFWYGGCEGNDNRYRSKEECDQICVEPQGEDRCKLPKVAGPCAGYYPQWYYDKNAKHCTQFVYGGCLGNNNRFETREDCMQLCVKDDSVDACEQPKEEGQCRGQNRRYFFNKEAGQCEEFIYGGCKGNNNNFRTVEACKQKCAAPGKKKHHCTLPKTEGNCTDTLPSWYYDDAEKSCMPFYYTGCNGNQNNFNSKEACESDCPPEVVKDTCHLPAETGECANYVDRWYFDTKEKSCRQFYYGGCGGNGNNFQTESECQNACRDVKEEEPQPQPEPPQPAQPDYGQPQPDTPPATAIVPSSDTQICFYPADSGPCLDNATTKYFYDSTDGVCKSFTYGGCGGNTNNFNSPEECLQYCGGAQDMCTLPPVVGPCTGQYEQYYYDSTSDSCKSFTFGGCEGNYNRFPDQASCEQRCHRTPSSVPIVTQAPPPVPSTDAMCYESPEAGNCSESLPAYFYDKNSGVCTSFTYTGCGGNGNRFNTEEQCERQCGAFREQDICNQDRDPGPCRGYFPKYYYDKAAGRCGQFVYGGCQGNGNRFSSNEECERICLTHDEPKPSATSTEICLLAADPGPCPEAYLRRWYFDNNRGECIAFIYSGCGGNLNNFKTFQACLDYCKDLLPQIAPEPSPPVEETSSLPAHECQAVFDECTTMRCQYGVEAYIDENECNRCQCHDPCKSVECPENQQCGIDLNFNKTSISDADFIAVCREHTKTGECPNLEQSLTNCVPECRSDADCTRTLKCCSTGCGTACVEPARPPAELVTQQPYLPAYTRSPIEVDPSQPPKIDVQVYEPEMSASLGDQVTLNCAVTGNPLPKITWSKGSLLIDDTMPRFRIKLDQTLQIITLHKTDAGIYLCTAENNVGDPITNQIKLDVVDTGDRPATIIDPGEQQILSNQIASLNSPLTINCYALGWPFPVVTWWKDDSMIPLKNNEFEVRKDYSLLIHSVQLHNLGIYTCQAYNGRGKAASWAVTVRANGPYYSTDPEDTKYLQYIINPSDSHTVLPPAPPPSEAPHWPYRPNLVNRPTPQPYIPPVYSTEPDIENNEILPELPPAQGGVPEPVYTVPVKANITTDERRYSTGSDVELSCHVTGFPVPQVQWYKDGIPVYPSDRISISDIYTLTIRQAQKSDSGSYQCEATNQYSRSSSSLTISVEGMYIHPSCTDNQFFAKCALIVEAKYCTHKYYAKFCCRSCTEAGLLPVDGPHIQQQISKQNAIDNNII